MMSSAGNPRPTGAEAALSFGRDAVNDGRQTARPRDALLVHPDDADAAVLAAQLRRLGWRVSLAWPLPHKAPVPESLVVVAIADDNIAEVGRWLAGHDGVVLGVLLDQHTRLVERIGELGLAGVLARPIRLATLQAQVQIAQAQLAWIRRLQGKASHLEVQLRARRTIEHATRILMVARDLGSEQAYEALRSRAMAERCAITEMASRIIDQARDW